MLPGGNRHILHDVREDLDWRPLNFVHTLPSAQVCSACGMAVGRTHLLPCRHVLCGPCHQQQSELAGPPCCPLDGEACPDDSVQWRQYPVKNLLELPVYCWNKDNGCRAVLAASELSRHFGLECEHHLASCPKCSAQILYNNLCLHLRSCTGRQEPIAAAAGAPWAGSNQQTSDLAELKTMLSTATREMGQQLLELKGRLEMLSLDSSLGAEVVNSLSHTTNSLKEVQVDQGNALSRTVDDLKETLQRDLVTVICQNRNGITRHAADIATVKQTVVETGRETSRKVDLVLRHILKTGSSHHWALKGYFTAKDRAMKDGTVDRFSIPVYLCHYLILPGVLLKRNGAGVSLHLQLCLKKGEVDEYLQWPFNKKMMLSVVHPDTGEQRTVESRPGGRKEFFSRPTASGNPAFYFDSSFNLNALERDSFIKSNQLDLCFSLLT